MVLEPASVRLCVFFFFLETLAFTWEKNENYGFFKNYCSLRPEKWYMQTTYGLDEGI